MQKFLILFVAERNRLRNELTYWSVISSVAGSRVIHSFSFDIPSDLFEDDEAPPRTRRRLLAGAAFLGLSWICFEAEKFGKGHGRGKIYIIS